MGISGLPGQGPPAASRAAACRILGCGPVGPCSPLPCVSPPSQMPHTHPQTHETGVRPTHTWGGFPNSFAICYLSEKEKNVITHNLGHGCGRDWSQEVLGATWWQAQGCRCTGSPPMLAQVHLACFFPQGLGGSRKVPGKVPSPGFCRREFKAHPHSLHRSLHQGAPRKSLEGILWRVVPLGSAARVVPPPVPTL